MEYISLFVSNREEFFEEKTCINCPVDCYCSCDRADILFDIDRILRKRLIDIGQDVKISDSLKIEMRLATGNDTIASLSHQGMLAICVSGNIIQFTNLNNNRQIEMRVESHSQVGFYDENMLLLTLMKPLRKAKAEDVFENPTTKTFKEIEGTNDTTPFTDVSLLHEKRVLHYNNTDYKLFSFNVDTEKNTEINVEKKPRSMASFTGIDCNAKAVFQSWDDMCTYILNNDNTITKVTGEQNNWITTLFPSASNPRNISNAMFKYDWDFIKCKSMMDTDDLMEFDYYSVVRVYRDIFLAYDYNINSWILVRILVL